MVMKSCAGGVALPLPESCREMEELSELEDSPSGPKLVLKVNLEGSMEASEYEHVPRVFHLTKDT
jgi:hypothetical protein